MKNLKNFIVEAQTNDYVKKSSNLGNGKLRTTFGKLVNYQALNEVIDENTVESIFIDNGIFPEGQFADADYFIEFVKYNFDTVVDCSWEFSPEDSCFYVYFNKVYWPKERMNDFKNLDFTFGFWNDDIAEEVDEKYDEEDDKWYKEYINIMLNDMDSDYAEPNFAE